MFKADGIDLSKTEFDELKFVLSKGENSAKAVEERTKREYGLGPAYKVLSEHGLISCAVEFDQVVFRAKAERKGVDWLASYEKAERDRKRLSRREWGMIAVNLGGGGALGGVVSLALHFCFGI